MAGRDYGVLGRKQSSLTLSAEVKTNYSNSGALKLTVSLMALSVRLENNNSSRAGKLKSTQ